MFLDALLFYGIIIKFLSDGGYKTKYEIKSQICIAKYEDGDIMKIEWRGKICYVNLLLKITKV